MSAISNSQSLKSVSLKLTRGNRDPATIGAAESGGSAERDSQKHGSSATMQKPPQLPGESAHSLPDAATLIDTLPLSPELDCAQEDQEDIERSEAQASSAAALQVLAEVIEFAQREKISDLQLQSGRHIYANGGGSTRPYEKWGKLSAADLNVMLDVFYDHRTLFDGLVSEGGAAHLLQSPSRSRRSSFT